MKLVGFGFVCWKSSYAIWYWGSVFLLTQFLSHLGVFMNHTLTVKTLAEAATIYIPKDQPGMRIIACLSDENYFLAEDEKTYKQHNIDYEDVDLDHDKFFKLQLMDNKTPFTNKVEK